MIRWALASVAMMFSFSAVAGDWPQWRGPERTGVTREKNLPSNWEPDGEGQLWKRDLGGMGAPIVVDGKVYFWSRSNEVKLMGTLMSGPKTQETLFCLDLETGKTIWSYSHNVYQTDVPFHRLGWSSPVADVAAGKIYAFGAACELICFDAKTGKVDWKRQMTEEFGFVSAFGGRTTSPMVDEDTLYLSGVSFGFADQGRGQHRVFAFDKTTGKLRWASPTGGPPVDIVQSTPIVAVIEGVRTVVTTSGDGRISAFTARTGQLLWQRQISRRGLNATPVIDGTRVYISHGEENIESPGRGGVFALDVAGGKVEIEWREPGIEAGFPSPTLHEGALYTVDDGGTMFAFDAQSGKKLWEQKLGTIGRPSPVIGDGKIYVADANGRFYIYKMNGKAKPTRLVRAEIPEKFGREYASFSSVAVSRGRVVLLTANTIYCIGDKNRVAVADDPIPAGPRETEGGDTKAVTAQVVPADVLLSPGESVKFEVRYFDKLGRLTTPPAGEAKWATGTLKILPPPPRPPAPTTGPATPPPAPPVAGPTTREVGNLAGEVTPAGVFTAAASDAHQVGGVVVSVGGVKGVARVRVIPPLPWAFDFSNEVVNTPPLLWLNAGGKYAFKKLDGKTVLGKLTENDLYARARTYFGPVGMANYTISSDVYVGAKIAGDRRLMPDIGVINSRYNLVLIGNHQKLQIHVWPAELPDEKKPSGSINTTIPYEWEPQTWYRIKLRVEQKDGKAIATGKVWKVGEPEPAEWTIRLEDPQPNKSGSPGVFGNTLVFPYSSETYWNNIKVEANK